MVANESDILLRLKKQFTNWWLERKSQKIKEERMIKELERMSEEAKNSWETIIYENDWGDHQVYLDRIDKKIDQLERDINRWSGKFE